MARMIEQLIGERIILRRPRPSDAAGIAFHVNDRSIARQTYIPYPYRLVDAHAFIKRTRADFRSGIRYVFSIVLKATNEVIGGVGIEMISRQHDCAEVGYWVSRFHRRQGIVSEALELAMRFAFKELGIHRLQAQVFVGNEASERLLRKFGYTYEGTQRGRVKRGRRWVGLMMFSMLRSEWRRHR